MCKDVDVAIARLVTGLYWTVTVSSSVDPLLAVDSLSLTDVDMPD